MLSDSYIVTLSRYEGECALNSTEVTNALSEGLATRYSPACVQSVRKYDPENEKTLTKIQAIKRVRDLLGTLLRDSKFLVDTAETVGQSRWSTVTIEHDSDGFRVIDKS